MSDKWETVVGPKRKPRPNKPQGQQNGQVGGQAPKIAQKPPKPPKRSAKIPASFPLAEEAEELPAPPPVPATSKKQSQKKTEGKHRKTENSKQYKEPKKQDLQTALSCVYSTELSTFFSELKSAGSASDVCLSWIKYCSDALNTKLGHVIPPDQSQWPNNLNFPVLPIKLESTIKSIIYASAEAREDLDILGVSYSSILAFIPTLIQRGDPGWGYLLFLREICKIDPSVPIRRWKSFSELMESYGNRKEIGLCVLWSVSQAAVSSSQFLKIVTRFLLPYYGFKHYKQLVLAATDNIISSTNMGIADPIIEAEDFEEFFEASFDAKKKKDFEKLYPRVKELMLKGLQGNGSDLFVTFLKKLSEKEFLPHSAYGKEVFEVLLGCVECDSECLDTWRDEIYQYPQESTTFLNYLAKHLETMNQGNRVEKVFIQSDEFARTAVKYPDLLRVAKRFQTKMDKLETARKKTSLWKILIVLVVGAIAGLLWLDVMENGKGTFAKSNTGRLLQKYGILNETLAGINFVVTCFGYVQEYTVVLFRSISEALRPLLQSFYLQVESYIPQVVTVFNTVWIWCVDACSFVVNFATENIFIGQLSPENLRKISKECLSFMWTTVIGLADSVYRTIEEYIK